MKKGLLLSILISCQILSGQILCIKCYDQNDSISSNVHNLIKNGGFENNTCNPNSNNVSFCPNSLKYGCDIKEWLCKGGGVNTYSTVYDSLQSIIPEGKTAVYFGNAWGHPCTKIDTDGFINNDCLNYKSCIITGIPSGFPLSDSLFGGSSGVSLEQTVYGLKQGNIYVLEFWAGGVLNGFSSGLFALDIGFGNTFLKCWPTRKTLSNTGTTYIIEFKATSSMHTIKFTNWGVICDACSELVLDNVRLYTLVELSPSVTPCVTETKNLNEDISIELYPNPFSNELLVKSNSFEQKEVTLYDLTSRKLILQNFINSVSLNTEQLAKGIYFYEVRNKNGVIKNGKVLKE